MIEETFLRRTLHLRPDSTNDEIDRLIRQAGYDGWEIVDICDGKRPNARIVVFEQHVKGLRRKRPQPKAWLTARRRQV